MILLVVLILLLATGLTTLLVMDKNKAYVGSSFLGLFFILLVCICLGCCLYPDPVVYFGDHPYYPGYAPVGFYPDPFLWGGGMGDTTVVNVDNNTYTGGGDGDGGGG